VGIPVKPDRLFIVPLIVQVDDYDKLWNILHINRDLPFSMLMLGILSYLAAVLIAMTLVVGPGICFTFPFLLFPMFYTMWVQLREMLKRGAHIDSRVMRGDYGDEPLKAMQKLKEKAPAGFFGGLKTVLFGHGNLAETVETDKGED
jgi:hypothetical protein